MSYTTIMGALEALQNDERWQTALTDEERYLCLKAADVKFHEAMDMAFDEIMMKLMLVNRLIAKCQPEKRELYMRALVE